MRAIAKKKPSHHYLQNSFIVLGLSACLLALGSCKPPALQNLAGLSRIDYDGRIVNKMAVRHETSLGTFFRRILVIESPKGERFTAYVNEGIYREVQPKMWTKSNPSGVQITGFNPREKED